MAAHYTEAQDAVILDGWALVPTAEIARQLGKSPNSVTRRALRGLRLPQLTSGRRWTDREDRWVTFHWGVDPPGVIASDLGRTLEAVQARARYRSLALGPWSRGTVSLRQMAVLVGWDRRAVRRALRAMHVPIRLVGRRSHIDELQAQKIGKWLADHPRSWASRSPRCGT